MAENIIYTHEHSTLSFFNEDELVSLLKEENKLIDCINLHKGTLKTSYYIGLSWMPGNKTVLYNTPKIDKENQRVDYLKMLADCLLFPEIINHSDDLFKIHFDEPAIKINKHDDHITPLTAIYFVRLVRIIVKKGLKRSYYKVEKNLNTRIKGKVLVSQSLKQNFLRNKTLYTTCSYEEFGINNFENRLIKKALVFILRYVNVNNNQFKNINLALDYILPAFQEVDENISLSEIKKIKHSSFYSEYSKAVDLALYLLRRFGYNINIIDAEKHIEVLPFWINMPKIYELYVLGKLKDACGNENIVFQFYANYGELDFLRITDGKEMVIDAKYKPYYRYQSYIIDDVRQLSGYARDIKTFRRLKISEQNWTNTALDCLIIYPEQNSKPFIEEEDLKSHPIIEFQNFYKLGLKLPTINQ